MISPASTRATSIASVPIGVTPAPTTAFQSVSASAGSTRNSSYPSSPPYPVRDRYTSTPPTRTGCGMNRKYRSDPRSSSVSFWTTSRERGPMTPRWGIDGVTHSNSASRSATSSVKNSCVLAAVGHHPAVVVLGGVEDRRVVHHQPLGVEERAVPRLPDREPQRVVAEHPLDGPQRVGTAELPLVQRRDVPHGDVVTDRGVLLRDVAEPLEPHPAAVLGVRAALRGGDLVECGRDRLVVAHGGMLP